jgi:hypothetical protein
MRRHDVEIDRTPSGVPGRGFPKRDMTFWDHLAEFKELAGELIIVGLGVVLLSRGGCLGPADEPSATATTGMQPAATRQAAESWDHLRIGQPVVAQEGRFAVPTKPSEQPITLSVPAPNDTTEADETRHPRMSSRSDRDTAPSPTGDGSCTDSAAPLLAPDLRPTPLNLPRPASFGQALHFFWDRRYPETIDNLELARQAAPDDAACLYFLALAHLRSGEPSLANETLAEAMELDAAQPVPDWGQLMERVQGKQRLWLEEARERARAMQVVRR